MFVSLCVFMNVCMHACIMYIYVCVHACIMYIYVCMYVCADIFPTSLYTAINMTVSEGDALEVCTLLLKFNMLQIDGACLLHKNKYGHANQYGAEGRQCGCGTCTTCFRLAWPLHTCLWRCVCDILSCNLAPLVSKAGLV